MRADQRERSKLKELRRFLPADKDDLSAVEGLVKMGYPAVQPLVPDMLKWTRDESWPVAKAIAEFLVAIGPVLVADLGAALGSRDHRLQTAALKIAGNWPEEAVRQLSARLFMIATNGQSWGADLLALRLLARHGIGDQAWIGAWLEFKREYHEARLAEIADIRSLLRGQPHGT